MKLSKNPTYKNLSWGPFAAVFYTIGIYLASQFLAVIGIYAALLLIGWNVSEIDTWISGGVEAQFVFSAAIAVTTILLLYLFMRHRKAHPDELGLVRPRFRDAGYALLGFLAYVSAYTVLVTILSGLLPGLDTTQTQELGFSKDTAGDALLLVFISLVVLPPIVEELMVRGFLFSGLRTKFSFWYAAVMSSLLFGMAHLSGGEGGSMIWIAVIDTFILGMVLAYLREKTGSLWSPIALHGLKNLTAFSFLFIFKDVI